MTRDELIAALEAATGPDRKLDREIAEAAQRMVDVFVTPVVLGAKKVRREFIAPDGSRADIPYYTGSRDAMLPGAEKLRWVIETSPSGPAEQTPWKAAAEGLHLGRAATEPLARRIAEIKALVPPDTALSSDAR